jgi:hypothetical protein
MMVHRCADHQGSTVNIGGSVSAGPWAAGNTIAIDANIATDIATIRTNKLNFSAGNMTTANCNAKSGTASWSSSSVHSFTQTFASYDAARHFHNQGGAMLFTASQSGGSGTQSADWATLLSSIGTVTVGVNTTTISGSGGTTGDSFDDVVGNAGTTRTIYTKASSGAYASNNYKIECSCNAAKEVFTWTVTFTDGHANGFYDTVNGTLTSTAQDRRASGTYIKSAAPSYSAGSFTQS